MRSLSLGWTLPMRPVLVLMACLGLQGQGTDESAFKGDPRKLAATFAERARILKPNDSRHLAALGRAFLANGERKRAEEVFAQAKALDPKDGETHRLILAAWLRSGHKAEALRGLDDWLLLDPKGRKPFAKGAVDLLEAGLDQKAQDLMERAWMLDTGDWEPCLAFVRAALRKHKPDLAARWASRAAMMKPQEEKVWRELAVAFADQGQEH